MDHHTKHIDYDFDCFSFDKDNKQLIINHVDEARHIKYLIFNKNFDEYVCYIFTCNVTYIKYGFYFNKNVDNLPKSVEEISFGNNFNKHVNMLPPKIKKLTFGNNFNKNIDLLPPILNTLSFGKDFSMSLNNLGKNVKILKLKYCYDMFLNKLPQLTHIIFHGAPTNPPSQSLRKDIKNIKHKNLPYSLKHIELCFISIKKIPYGCKLFDQIGFYFL